MEADAALGAEITGGVATGGTGRSRPVEPTTDAPTTDTPTTDTPTTDTPTTKSPGAGYWIALACALVLMAFGILLTTPNPVSASIGLGAPPGAELVYVADLDFWQRTPRQTNVAAAAYFDLDHDLNNVPMQLGDWVGVDRPEENEEVMILLEPEQYVQRLYENSDGKKIWLTMVGGRSSQPFHAPDICYDADGWQYSLGSHPVALNNGGEIYGLYLNGRKFMPKYNAEAEHVVFYFYLFPDQNRSLSDGIVLFKLTSNRSGTVEETLAEQEDFIRHLFTQAGDNLEPQPPLATAINRSEN